MASPSVDDGGGGDDVLIIIKCLDPQTTEPDSNHDNDEVMISASNVHSWDFPSILRHRIIKVKAHRNRLMEHSSYFHGLLAGNFSDSYLEVLTIQWNQLTFLNLLASMFDRPVDITSVNFVPILEGALYFGMEMLLVKCKMWLTKAISMNGVLLVQLNDLINIWNFGSEHVNDYIPELCTSYLAKNFMWAMSCNSFGDVPYALLLSSIRHSHLTVDSEKHLCDALLTWIAANKEQCAEDVWTNLLKQVRISLLPLWFTSRKRTCEFFSMCCDESFSDALILLKQPSKFYMDVLGDNDLLKLRIRLTEFSQRVDLSGCPQINPVILLLSVLPCFLSLEPMLRKKVEQLYINRARLGGNAIEVSWGVWPYLTFEAVQEIDISNCPMLRIEASIECFSKSFPSLRKLKAVNHLSFRTKKLWQLVKGCPSLCDIDLTVDVSPVIPTQVSILSSFPAITSRTSSASFDPNTSPLIAPLSYISRTLPSNITKLTLEGRIDIGDADLQSISAICVSLSYLSLKGCTSLSDNGISYLIRKCVKLNSIVACDTWFGQQSILALCSSINSSDHVAEKQSGKSLPHSLACNLQMLHIGGCKGINASSFSALMSQAYMLKSLCLREADMVDDGLLNFFGSSLQVLDISNTKVSAATVAHIVSRNPGMQCLKIRDCRNLVQQGNNIEGAKFYFELGKSCKLEEITVGWGFSCFSLEALKPALSLLKAAEVGLGGLLGHDGLKLLPAICPLLESVVLYFQVISDHVIMNMLESLRHLKSFALCHCLGDISPSCFKVIMPNLTKLKLERVAPWMNNAHLGELSQNCANLIELSLLGCRLLNSDSQKVISGGWPGLITLHLEECGDVTGNGVVSLLDCHALEDILLRHNGSGIQKDFISDAISKLPMLRKLSLDICDAKDRDFDIPNFADRHFLSDVTIARCKSERCNLELRHIEAGTRRSPIQKETLVVEWDSKQLTKTLVKERF